MVADRMINVGWPGQVGRLRQEQIRHIETWDAVPDAKRATAAMFNIRCIPAHSTTVTYVNPLDPGDQDDGCWRDAPTNWGSTYPAWRP